MTGGGGKPRIPAPPPPSPTPMVQEEVEEAKRLVRKKPRGRAATILAGRLMSEHGRAMLGPGKRTLG